MFRQGVLFEYGTAIGVFVLVLVVTLATQDRIAVNAGRGYDGVAYYDLSQQLTAGQPPTGVLRFASRVGTPLLAALVDPSNLLNGFQVVNLGAAFISTLLFLAWLRRFLEPSWLRLALVVVYATHWLQLIRFTVFYPVLVDAWAQALCFAGLNAIASYEQSPSGRKLAAITAIGALGVAFRDIVLLVPLAFVFCRSSRRFHNVIPLAVAAAAFAFVRQAVTATDPLFSTSGHLLDRALSRSALSYLLGWLVAFGPGVFVILFDWRGAAAFLARHRWALVYVGGVAAAAWAGSLESERHALNWASPVIYVLIGGTIQRHPHWFKGALLAVVVASQALVSRVFWTIPQPTEDYSTLTPAVVLTPLGPDATYLHLFPDYPPRALAWLQLWQFAALGAVMLALMWWRTLDASLPATVRAGRALADARTVGVNAALASARRVKQMGVRGLVWLFVAFVSVAGVTGTALVQMCRAQPVRINVRWKEHVGPVERQRLERQLHLAAAADSEDTTWEYVLTEPSPEHVGAVVAHPAVEDTEHVDRESLRPERADELERRAWLFAVLIGLTAAVTGAKAVPVVKGLDDLRS